MVLNMKMTNLVDWAIVEWDGERKLLGINKETGDFIRTSPIAEQVSPTVYKTASGNMYFLLGPPAGK